MTQSLSTDERRTTRRVLRVRAAMLSLEGAGQRQYEVRTENASDEGLALRMPVALPVRARVEVGFTLPPVGPRLAITLEAAVVHTLLSGDTWLTGLSIVKISEQHRKLLAAYCAKSP